MFTLDGLADCIHHATAWLMVPNATINITVTLISRRPYLPSLRPRSPLPSLGEARTISAMNKVGISIPPTSMRILPLSPGAVIAITTAIRVGKSNPPTAQQTCRTVILSPLCETDVEHSPVHADQRPLMTGFKPAVTLVVLPERLGLSAPGRRLFF